MKTGREGVSGRGEVDQRQWVITMKRVGMNENDLNSVLILTKSLKHYEVRETVFAFMAAGHGPLLPEGEQESF